MAPPRLARRLLACVATVVALAAIVSPASAGPAPATQLVRVPVASPEQARLLAGFDVAESRPPGALDVVLHPGDADRLRALGFSWQVLVADLAARDLAALSAPHVPQGAPGERTEYRHYDDPLGLGVPSYAADLAALAAAHPDKARLIMLPEPTLEGRSVWGIEIASNVGARDGRPVFYMDGVHHAREWPAGEMVIMFAYDLLESYGLDPRVTAVVDETRTILVPVVNPDGFNTSRESLASASIFQLPLGIAGLEGYWRKNRRGVAGVVIPVVRTDPTAYGVDPNRNYSFLWGDTIGGSSGTSIDQTYRGISPFSEPETRNVRSIVLSNPVTAMITHHTSGRLILRPWGHTHADPPDEPLMAFLGTQMSLSMPSSTRYTSQPGIGLYATTGTTDDWAYAATGSLGYTFEHGTEFHGPYSQIIPTMYTRTRTSYLILAEAARNPAYHSVVTGRIVGANGAPIAGGTLEIEKSFRTPTWNGSVPEEVFFTEGAQPDGTFALHLNPSTRPVAAQTEAYAVTISAPGHAPLLRSVIVARGQTLALGDVVLEEGSCV